MKQNVMRIVVEKITVARITGPEVVVPFVPVVKIVLQPKITEGPKSMMPKFRKVLKMECPICHKQIKPKKEVFGYLHTTKGDLVCHLSCIKLFRESGIKSIDFEKGLIV
jgi:hypothetical protein